MEVELALIVSKTYLAKCTNQKILLNSFVKQLLVFMNIE